MFGFNNRIILFVFVIWGIIVQSVLNFTTANPIITNSNKVQSGNIVFYNSSTATSGYYGSSYVVLFKNTYINVAAVVGLSTLRGIFLEIIFLASSDISSFYLVTRVFSLDSAAMRVQVITTQNVYKFNANYIAFAYTSVTFRIAFIK